MAIPWAAKTQLTAQYLVSDSIPAKCELRDVIFSFAVALFLKKSVWVF